MFHIVLAFHSLVRWFVLISLLYAIFRGYRGWLYEKTYTTWDHRVRHITATVAQIQLVFGLWLYVISPIARYFRSNVKAAVHERQIRFFGMEHSLMMLIAIIVISFGSSIAKRKRTDKQKFKTMAVWFTIALIIILTSIPWAFSPIVSRPYFRSF